MRQPNEGGSPGQEASQTGWHAHVLVGMEGLLSPMRDLSPMPTRTWACHPGMASEGGCAFAQNRENEHSCGGRLAAPLKSGADRERAERRNEPNVNLDKICER